MEEQRRAELQAILNIMTRQAEQLCTRLVFLSMGSRCMGFLEHAGLMNQYIVACSDALKGKVDFTTEHPPLDAIRLALIREKLACIYGPGIALQLALRTPMGKLSRVRAIELRAELEALYGKDVIERLEAAKPGFNG